MIPPQTLDRPAAGAVRLAGRRVFLRPFAPSDWEAWRALHARSEAWLAPWEPLADHATAPASADEFEAWTAAWAADWEHDTAYGFALLLTNGELIGEVGLGSVQRHSFDTANLGYWIDEQHAGRGYVPEALVAVMRFAFEQLQLHRLEALIMPANQPSVRVAEKLGLRHEGVSLRLAQVHGTYEDLARYAMTAEEWRTQRADLIARLVSGAPRPSAS